MLKIPKKHMANILKGGVVRSSPPARVFPQDILFMIVLTQELEDWTILREKLIKYQLDQLIIYRLIQSTYYQQNKKWCCNTVELMK